MRGYPDRKSIPKGNKVNRKEEAVSALCCGKEEAK